MTAQTDRELLEAAARAAGVLKWDHIWCNAGINFGSNATPAIWNPLTDDGDALRLAVKLNLWEAVRDGYQHLDSDNDFCAATRRSIVRAAAALAPKEQA